eukprot:PhF_6_TR40237/c0_g1_i1/m.59829
MMQLSMALIFYHFSLLFIIPTSSDVSISFLENMMSLPNAVYGHNSIFIDDAYYVIGGSLDAALTSREVSMYLKGAWRSIVTLRFGRRNFLLTKNSDLGLLYVVGGESGDTRLMDLRRTNVSGVVEIYDPSHERWTYAQVLPAARYLSASVIFGSGLYVFGGRDGTHRALRDVDIYDMNTHVWSPGPPMPSRLCGHAAVISRGHVYVLGGYNPTTKAASSAMWYLSGDVWVPVAPMSYPRDRPDAWALEHYIVVAGGMAGERGELIDVIEIYDTSYDQWTSLATRWPVQRVLYSTAYYIDHQSMVVYVSGGRSISDMTVTNQVDKVIITLQDSNNDNTDRTLQQWFDENLELAVGVGVGIVLVQIIWGTVLWRRRRARLASATATSTEQHSAPTAIESNLLKLDFLQPDETMAREASPPMSPMSPRSPVSPQSPSRRFVRGEMLGKGAHGCVYVGVRPDGSLVAVKVIQLKRFQSTDLLESIAREVQVMRNLPSHENVVQYMGTKFNSRSRELSIMMEYCVGGSLGQMCRKMERGLPEDIVRSYTLQILRGLQHLHRNNIIHRDIKGDNVLMGAKGLLKLADFGTAKALDENGNEKKNSGDSNSSTSTIVGTPLWMAPEVLTGASKSYPDEERLELDKKADVWSVGCTVVEMLTCGGAPWPNYNTIYEAVLAIGTSEGLPTNVPDTISPVLKSFLSLCFERDVRNRSNVDTLLLHAFLSEHRKRVKTIDEIDSVDSTMELLENVANLAGTFSGTISVEASVSSKRRSESLGVTIHTLD